MRKERSRQEFRVAVLVLLLGGLLACNLSPAGQGPEEEWLDLPATETAIADQPSPTLTPIAVMETSVTETPALAVLPIPDDQLDVLSEVVEFRPGGTSRYIQGLIKNGEKHLFKLVAAEGQAMILSVTSSSKDVYLSLLGDQNGEELVAPGSQISQWTGILPANQEYQIGLTTSNPETDYFLTIEIPANINFAPGTDSITVDGYIEVDLEHYPSLLTRVRYLLYAAGGQTIQFSLTSDHLDNLTLSVFGQDGELLIPHHVKNTGGTMVLPSTQGYYIDVYSTSVESAEFSLFVKID